MLTCDREGCLYRAGGHSVALERSDSALLEDCGRAELVIMAMPSRGACRGTPVIDRSDIWRNGSYSVWLKSDRIEIESVRDWRGVRPWAPKRGADPAPLNTAEADPPAGPAP